MPSRIADRLLSARERQMVGREAELVLFYSAIAAEEMPFLLLYLHGPSGIGKSTLLRAFQAGCHSRNIPVTLVDARNLEASPEMFVQALGAAMGLSAGEDAIATLGGSAERRVLLLDTYENLLPIDDWVRDVFIPQLSADTLIVVASTTPPPLSWRGDTGWHDLLCSSSLRNLSPEESITYLENRGIPAAYHQEALNFTHGFPLALSLLADMFVQRGESAVGDSVGFVPEAAPNVVQALLERFIDKVPSPAHRTALEISALVRLTTEALLQEMLSEGEDAHELFQWLRGLSFMEASRQGLYPHDVAREALIADLRWRNRDRYAELHRRARAYYSRHIDEAQGLEQQGYLFDYIYLHRDNSIVRSAFDWQDNVALRTDALKESDIEPLVQQVERFEGAESAKLARYWLQAQPENVLVFRDHQPEPAGFLLQLAIHKATASERELDPAVAAAWRYLEKNAPLRPSEAAAHLRFWMARGTYHAISPVQSQIIVHVVRHYLTNRHLAFSFFPVMDPVFWARMFAYAELQRQPEADYQIGEKQYGVYTQDWRTLPPTEWLARLAEKEIAAGRLTDTPPHPRREPLVVLSESDFEAAVRTALRSYSEPGTLSQNPLLRSRLVMERIPSVAGSGTGHTPGTEEATLARVSTLRSLLQEATESLQNHPRKTRGYRPVSLTYLRPGLSQERVSEMLDLPFSTYRRHLAEGIAEVTRYLWLKEIGEQEGDSGEPLSSK
jgi:hypothetical protein